MQISNQEVHNAQKIAEQRGQRAASAPVHSVEELAERNQVKMEEVRRFTERVMMSEEDPLRERRLREIAARVAGGSYGVESEDLLDMAERRAIADRAAEL
jgi:hypothetical protein